MSEESKRTTRNADAVSHDVEGVEESKSPSGELHLQLSPKVAGYIGGAVFYMIFKLWSPLGPPESLGQAFLFGAVPSMMGFAVFSVGAKLMNR